MESSNTLSSTPQNQDPVASLPRDMILHLFQFLPSDEIYQSAAINRDWRTTILSSPSVFSCLKLIDNGMRSSLPQGTQDANKLIKKVLRYANLNGNRLEEVDLLIRSFRDDPKLSPENWGATKLSIVFNILSFSSHSLKTISLEFPPSNRRLPVEVLHVAAIIENLKPFESLKAVKITADAAISLCSGNQNSKLIEIKDSNTSTEFRHYRNSEFRWKRGFNRDGWERESDEKSTFKQLFSQVSQFTGEGIKEVVYIAGPMLSSEFVEELLLSRNDLEEIVLKLSSIHERESVWKKIFKLVIQCPNLSKLNLTIVKDEALDSQGSEDAPQIWRFPKGSNLVSKLSTLTINLEVAAHLYLDKNFFKWIGEEGALQYLYISGPVDPWFKYFPLTEPIEDLVEALSYLPALVDFKSLLSFITLSGGSYLRSLNLHSVYLSPGKVSDQVIFPNLEALFLNGNLELIKFFTSCLKCNSLRMLILETADASQSQDLDHANIIRIMSSCKSTLQEVTIEISDPVSVEVMKETSFPIQEEVKDLPNRFSLSRLQLLKLYLDDETISKFYLHLYYPEVTEAFLPPSYTISASLKASTFPKVDFTSNVLPPSRVGEEVTETRSFSPWFSDDPASSTDLSDIGSW